MLQRYSNLSRLLCSSIDCIILLCRLCNIIINNIHNTQRNIYLQLCYKDIVISHWLLCNSIDCIILLCRLCNIIIKIHNIQRNSYFIVMLQRFTTLSLGFFVVNNNPINKYYLFICVSSFCIISLLYNQ